MVAGRTCQTVFSAVEGQLLLLVGRAFPSSLVWSRSSAGTPALERVLHAGMDPGDHTVVTGLNWRTPSPSAGYKGCLRPLSPFLLERGNKLIRLCSPCSVVTLCSVTVSAW